MPLRIDVQHGEASIEQVAQDILGLTKLNYNACKLGESRPVTVGFSDAGGDPDFRSHSHGPLAQLQVLHLSFTAIVLEGRPQFATSSSIDRS